MVTADRELVIHVDVTRDALRRAILAVAPAASGAGDTVPVLEYVSIETGDDGSLSLIATDRYRLHTVTLTAETTSEEYGRTVTAGHVRPVLPVSPMRVNAHAKQLVALAKTWREPRVNDPGYDPDGTRVTVHADHNGVTFTSSDGSTGIVSTFDADFPSWRSLMPDEVTPDAIDQDKPERTNPHGAALFAVSPRYIGDATKACDVALGRTKRDAGMGAIIQPGTVPTKPVAIYGGIYAADTSGNAYGPILPVDGVVFRALVMPIRIRGSV